MNLPPEHYHRWGHCIRVADRHLRINRRYRWVMAALAMLYPWLAAGSYLAGRPWQAVVNMVVGWFMYRMYRRSLKDEQQWRVLRHHLGRVLAETPERALWHTEQIGVMLEEIKKS